MACVNAQRPSQFEDAIKGEAVIQLADDMRRPEGLQKTLFQRGKSDRLTSCDSPENIRIDEDPSGDDYGANPYESGLWASSDHPKNGKFPRKRLLLWNLVRLFT